MKSGAGVLRSAEPVWNWAAMMSVALSMLGETDEMVRGSVWVEARGAELRPRALGCELVGNGFVDEDGSGDIVSHEGAVTRGCDFYRGAGFTF